MRFPHVIVCLVVAAACGRGSTPAGNTGSAKVPAMVAKEPVPVAAIEVWPARWKTAVAALPSPARDAVGDKDLWVLASFAAKGIGIRGIELPPPGLDPDAPIAVEIFADRAR